VKWSCFQVCHYLRYFVKDLIGLDPMILKTLR